MAKKKKKPDGGNAVIYARYSSHNQREAVITTFEINGSDEI